MVFYLITAGQTNETITDHNILGEVSFNQFHVGIAWAVLRKLVDSTGIALEKLDIVDSTGKHWKIDSFLSFIEQYTFIHY